MASDSKEMTSFSCPFGKFQFNRMPFGLRNVPAIFQSVVDDVLRPVSDQAANYIDDVIIFSADWEANLKDLEGVVKGGRTPPTHSVAMCSNYRSSPCKTILPIYKLQVPPEDTTLQL